MKTLVKVLFFVLVLLLAFACYITLRNGSPSTPAPESTAAATQGTSAATTESTVAVTTTVTTAATTVPTETEAFVPEIHPDIVGIYIPAADGTAARKHVTEFAASRTAKKDIDCFEILATREAVAKGSSFRSIWTGAWDAHENADKAKIGFRIEFPLDSGEIVSAQLLKPSDAKDFYDYLEIYMYDDIHQTPGVWYTHLEDKDMREDTIVSSIKLTAGSKIAQVGDIALTAFIYTGPECFDAAGNYIGLVWETLLITQP